MFEDLDPEHLRRLLAFSHALPLQELLRDLADDIVTWQQEGFSENQINNRIVEHMREHGGSYPEWAEEMQWLVELLPKVDLRKVWDAYGIEDWYIACARSYADTDKPIPFHPYAGGFYFPVPDEEWPILVTVTTKLTDPKLAAKQLIDEHRKFFGALASKPNKSDEVEAAEMMEMHRLGVSYRDIAIHNLRPDIPEIVYLPEKYKKLIDKEKSRVAKRIASAEQTWKKRGA